LVAEGRDRQEQPPEALAGDPAVQSFFRTRIDTALAEMANWEQIRKFLVLPRPFTVAGEELTVSLKLRREVIFSKYKADLEALYVECDDSSLLDATKRR
jgi:long-chain acyl-CoA synthetase